MSTNTKFPTSVAPTMSLGQPSGATSDVSQPQPQPLLTTQQLPSIVSLPQNFCFTSQPAQTSVTATQPLSVTLGFPMGAQAALNTGTIPQQFVQSLSVGQQPTICASLPQSLSFPLNQALFTVPSAGTSTGQFLSTTFSQFPGIQSLIMGGQQSVIPGTIVGAPPASQIQTLGSLTPQSLSFPVSSGPVVTELPPDQAPQAQQQSQHQTPAAQTLIQPQPTSVQPPLQQNTQNMATPPLSSGVPQQNSTVQQQNQITPQNLPSQPQNLAAPQNLTPSQQNLGAQQQYLTVQQQTTQQPNMSIPQQNLTVQHQPQQITPSDQSLQPSQEQSALPQRQAELQTTAIQQMPRDSQSVGTVSASAGTGTVSGSSAPAQTTVAETLASSTANENHAQPASEKKAEDTPIPAPPAPEKISSPAVNNTNAQTPAVKEETTVLNLSPEKYKDEDSAADTMLIDLKQEVLDDEEEEMQVPDSTPATEENESMDGYSQRQSPSPMASLQLTRADTTTTASLAYANSERTEDPEADMKSSGLVDVTLEGLPADDEDCEFVWEDYLQETGAAAVPPTAFKHVECSLQSGFVKGMRVEVANKSVPGTYWVASLVMTCGPLLRLRFEGYDEDGSADFWCDLSSCDIHPVGWCKENGQKLEPPAALKEKFSDWMAELQKILKSVKTAPSYLLDKTTGTTPIDQIKQGMRLELQDAEKPNQVWLARIIENVGGRLYLRVEGMDSGASDFWAFYLHERLHPIGWAKQMGYKYHPPSVLEEQGLSQQEIQNILTTALKEAEEQSLPADIFKDQAEIPEHKFRQGMKLEAVSPRTRNHICPATVVEVIDSRSFVVEIDDLQEMDAVKRIRFCCHGRTPTIFPIQWTVYKGIKLTPPPGWSRPDFNWSEYLAHCRATAAPENCFDLNVGEHEFERGMKLEAVNPDSPNQICAATITKIVDHLMWIHLDSSTRIVASHVEHISSHNLFPVGWCESNGYQLRPPRKTGLKSTGSARKRVAVVQPEMADGGQAKEEETEGRTYCPKIYFNHKCFSGPYLSKGRIAELPRSVGPGPLQLVMKEVLSMLISVAYKSSRVLREIQLDGPPNPAMTQQILKAKYKNKSYRAVVEICRTTAQLEDFCRQVCIKLECCPNLISPHFVGDNCPEHCSQLTKTKYTYYYGKKKRKIGRPPGGHTNLENGPKKPLKRKRRRKIGLVIRKSHTTNEEDEDNEDKASVASDTRTADSSSTTASHDNDHKPTSAAVASKRLKRKYTHHIPPPSEIRTRGAKLPRYSFERRTHKKILLSAPTQSVSSLRSKTVQLQPNPPVKVNRTPTPEPSPQRPRPSSPLPVNKNPLHWSIAETVEFIQTTDCSHVAKVFREQEIDGQALLLLTLPTVQEHLELKLGPAIKLCHQIERVKRVFYEQYASQS